MTDVTDVTDGDGVGCFVDSIEDEVGMWLVPVGKEAESVVVAGDRPSLGEGLQAADEFFEAVEPFRGGGSVLAVMKLKMAMRSR